MRRLVRWMVLLGALVGVVWASASIDVRGKTAIGHALAWWKKQDFFTSKEKPAPKKPVKKKEAARPAPPAPPVEKDATAKRVALLERAAEAIDRDRGNPGGRDIKIKTAAPARVVESSEDPGAKTLLGEKPSPAEKKALDELVSSRVPRGR